MAIAAGDAAVPVVNSELSALVTAHYTTSVDGFLLRIVMATGAVASAAPYIPTAAPVGDYVVSFGAFPRH